MLNRDPSQRIGIIDKSEIKNDEFFEGLDWEKLEKKQYEPPLLEEELEDELTPFERVFISFLIILINIVFLAYKS